jgi:uncharacterized protein
MKKQLISIIILLVLISTVFSGCTVNESNDDNTNPPTDEVSLETKSRCFIENLTNENYKTVYQKFTSEMKSVLPVEDLQYAWESLLSSYGAFEEIVRTKQSEEQGYQLVYVTCSFSSLGFLDLRFVFDDQDRIAGFQFVPTESTENYSSPNYVNASLFTEQNITFGSDPWQLPATISIPIGSGPFPAVVLVHGSGPNDRDETIGPNKPFKDIAQGLASKGIMVLRYDKRTNVYSNKFAALTNYTPQKEVITDAVSAISYLQNHTLVNQNQMFLLGHSLGAMMAPEISRQSSDLTGVIMLATPARPFEDLYLDQISYLFELDGTIDEQEQEQINEIEESVQKIKHLNITENDSRLNLPKSYWEYLSTYDPIETAQNLTAPLFLLQGKRDYQITYEDDFIVWQNTFNTTSKVSFQSYESLNHLFISGSGTPTNTEYLSPGNVDEAVINDIEHWIKNR